MVGDIGVEYPVMVLGVALGVGQFLFALMLTFLLALVRRTELTASVWLAAGVGCAVAFLLGLVGSTRAPGELEDTDRRYRRAYYCPTHDLAFLAGEPRTCPPDRLPALTRPFARGRRAVASNPEWSVLVGVAALELLISLAVTLYRWYFLGVFLVSGERLLDAPLWAGIGAAVLIPFPVAVGALVAVGGRKEGARGGPHAR
jgi:hypothetical protein